MNVIVKKFYLSHKSKPYIKKIETIGKTKVWLVDSKFIRKHICEDFVNKGQHYHFNFIPKDEFWIAKEAHPGETQFYIDYLIAENRLMKKGSKRKNAVKEAFSIERIERKKDKVIKNIKRIKNHEKLLKKVHRKIFIQYKDLKVWVINGEVVRDIFTADFAGGGHHKVYYFIPYNEIWIDDDIPKEEVKFIVVHELHERYWMNKNNYKYLPAHRKATKVEDYCRNHSDKTEDIIKKELKRQV